MLNEGAMNMTHRERVYTGRRIQQVCLLSNLLWYYITDKSLDFSNVLTLMSTQVEAVTKLSFEDWGLMITGLGKGHIEKLPIESRSHLLIPVCGLHGIWAYPGLLSLRSGKTLIIVIANQ